MREPESELSGSASLRANRDSLLLIVRVSACDENASRVAGPHVNLHS